MSEPTILKIRVPNTINELHKFIIVGEERLRAYQALIRAADKAGIAKELRDELLEDAQYMGEALIYAEAKLGELLRDLPPNIESLGRATIVKRRSLPRGITKQQSHMYQTLASHPDIIREVVEKARLDENIPTRYQVLKRIKGAATEKKKRPAAFESIQNLIIRANERQLDEIEKNITCLMEAIAGRRAELAKEHFMPAKKIRKRKPINPNLEMILSISSRGGIRLTPWQYKILKENNPNIKYLEVKNARYGVDQWAMWLHEEGLLPNPELETLLEALENKDWLPSGESEKLWEE